MHSYNSLSSGDVYSNVYGVEGFYEDATAQAQFDARLKHIMNHKHKTLRLPWKYLSAFIFAFEAENEAMIGLVSFSSEISDALHAKRSIGTTIYHRPPTMVSLGSPG